MITNRTLALLRLAPAHLLDQLAAAPNQVVRVKHEQYGGRLVCYLEPRAGLRLQLEWDVDSYVSYSPSLRLGAVTLLMESDGRQTYGALALLWCTVNFEIERT
ncbi:hypothetical protein EDB85DRAFT_1973063 [Lactarius pseudohatsudake]|nr:hypothetical protein EDB85DRAFT_1973063 [Lactarius pseudohatsudake]